LNIASRAAVVFPVSVYFFCLYRENKYAAVCEFYFLIVIAETTKTERQLW